MKYPKINISPSDMGLSEEVYICFLAKNISTATYQNGGFSVLPHLETNDPRSVYFPDLGLSKAFWRAINFNPNINLTGQFPASAVDEVKEKLASYKRKHNFDNDTEKIKKEWERIEKDLFTDLNTFIDFKKSLSKVSKINVLITPFGTRGSFNPPRVGNDFNLNITSRIDQPAGNIASGILQTLYIIETWIGGEIGEENYLKRMSAISFLMKHSVFKKYYPNFVDLTTTKFTANQKLIQASQKYLKKLGFPVKTEIDPSTIKTLTPQEEKILASLIRHKGNLVSFDTVANILWANKADDKFSLEAMAKVIEGLRKKIKKSGINKEVIFTKRGKGYFINF